MAALLGAEDGPASALSEGLTIDFGLRGEAEAGLRGECGAASAKGRIGRGASGVRLGIWRSNLVQHEGATSAFPL